MADTLPINFPLISENISANYDFTDLVISGTGFVQYYLCSAGTSGGAVNFLTPIALEGYTGGSGSTHSINDDATDHDLDLSANNYPRTIRGQGYFSFTLTKNSTSSHAVTMQLKKWDGSSETDISASVTSEATALSGDTHMLVPFTVPETLIKKGEQIRLTVNIPDSSGTAFIPLNPLNKPAILYIPYKIEQ